MKQQCCTESSKNCGQDSDHKCSDMEHRQYDHETGPCRHQQQHKKEGKKNISARNGNGSCQIGYGRLKQYPGTGLILCNPNRTILTVKVIQERYHHILVQQHAYRTYDKDVCRYNGRS